LLATDFAPDCDRALERSKQLAAELSLPVEVLTVYAAPQAQAEVRSWLDDGDAGARAEGLARREVACEFAGTGIAAHARFASGKVDEAILREAAALPGYLVVTGAVRHETLARVLAGSTVERLARALAQPLLAVRKRVRGPYRSILVPVDGSPAARRALRLAVALFPGRPIVAFHVRTGAEALGDQVEAAVELERFIDDSGLGPRERALVEAAVGDGTPEAVLRRIARQDAIDLAVLGLHEEPALRRLLMGSRSEQLLRELACDTLLVPHGAVDACP
jgi:nucleotide-binding universal stress UspA family protein